MFMGNGRASIKVIYTFVMENEGGKEMTFSFSYDFDEKLYYEDVEVFDNTMVNFKLQDIKMEHGKDLLLVEYFVERYKGSELH